MERDVIRGPFPGFGVLDGTIPVSRPRRASISNTDIDQVASTQSNVSQSSRTQRQHQLDDSTTIGSASFVCQPVKTGKSSIHRPADLSDVSPDSEDLHRRNNNTFGRHGTSNTLHSPFGPSDSHKKSECGPSRLPPVHEASIGSRISKNTAAVQAESHSPLNPMIVVIGFILWGHGFLSGVMRHSPQVRKFIGTFMLPIGAAILFWKRPIARRMIASLLFFFITMFCMCIANSIAWFRNPKFGLHLPDVAHELVPVVKTINIPLPPQEWVTPFLPIDLSLRERLIGFLAPGYVSMEGTDIIEMIIGFLSISNIIFTCMQPCRWLILRRFFVIYGALAFLRSFTVFATQLPDASEKCRTLTPEASTLDSIDYELVLERAMELLIPVGTVTCGDMVFSGHTMVMVLHALTWHTYYKVMPGTMTINIVKTFMWLVVSVGLTLIVVTRLHYTLDVLLAAYLAVTIWGSYHRWADDVIVGHRFHSVWLIDGLLLYPAIQWLEAPHLGEARRGMIEHILELKRLRRERSKAAQQGQTNSLRFDSVTGLSQILPALSITANGKQVGAVNLPQKTANAVAQVLGWQNAIDEAEGAATETATVGECARGQHYNDLVSHPEHSEVYSEQNETPSHPANCRSTRSEGLLRRRHNVHSTQDYQDVAHRATFPKETFITPTPTQKPLFSSEVDATETPITQAVSSSSTRALNSAEDSVVQAFAENDPVGYYVHENTIHPSILAAEYQNALRRQRTGTAESNVSDNSAVFGPDDLRALGFDDIIRVRATIGAEGDAFTRRLVAAKLAEDEETVPHCRTPLDSFGSISSSHIARHTTPVNKSPSTSLVERILREQLSQSADRARASQRR